MLAAPLLRELRPSNTHWDGRRRRGEQAFHCVDQGVQHLSYAIRKLFRLFPHLAFIMDLPVTLSTPSPILFCNSQLLERRCTSI
jgi:hypothetical protein